MFTDSHCHLDFPELFSQLAQIRIAMAAMNVTRALCISTRLLHAGKELGTLPMPPSDEGDVLIFAGRRWQIVVIDHDKLRVDLKPANTGQPPITLGGGLPVHDRVRQEMRLVLAGTDVPPWLDDTARAVLADARRQYVHLQLAPTALISEKRTVCLFLWLGDATQDALEHLLNAQGLSAKNVGMCVKVSGTCEADVGDAQPSPLHHCLP